MYSRILALSGIQSLSQSYGILNADGSLGKIHFNTYSPSDSGHWISSSEATAVFKDDSVMITSGDSTGLLKEIRNKYLGIFFDQALSFLPIPFTGLFSGNHTDTISSGEIHVQFPRQLEIDKNGKGFIRQPESTEGSLILYLSGEGKLDSIRGTGGISDISGIVFRKYNFDSLAIASVPRREKRFKPHRILVDSVVFDNGDLSIRVHYERPDLNGKKIFGYTVPFNQVWVTGVDSAVEFSINKPVSFYGQQLEKGNYSLLTIPRKDYWMLIINRKTGIRAADYNSSDDVLRVPMKVDSLAKLINELTINIKPFDTGGVLTIKWENTGAVVMFK